MSSHANVKKKKKKYNNNWIMDNVAACVCCMHKIDSPHANVFRFCATKSY